MRCLPITPAAAGRRLPARSLLFSTRLQSAETGRRAPGAKTMNKRRQPARRRVRSMTVAWPPSTSVGIRNFDHQTERGKISFGQTVQHKGMICTIVIVLYFHQVFHPVQCWVGGGILPPALLQYSRNATPVTTKVKRLHQGYSVISLDGIVRIGHSYSSHMQHGAWQPSARTFGGLRDVPPLLFVTSMSPAESRRFRTSPSGA